MSAEPVAVEPARVFTALADIVYRGPTMPEIYSALCVAATLIVPGCDHASILLRRENGAYVIAAATDRVARHVDELEKQLGEGPCLDAIEDESAQVDTDLTAHSRWPALAARVVAETPVRGAMGFRLLVDGRKVGALNLFATAPKVFDAAATQTAVVLAAFASVATNAVARGEDATSLARGLASNREIGKAIGMLMVLNDIGEQEAFAILRRISQATNVKLAEVAAQLVHRRGQLPAG
ncbi:MAG TPA: GAF and ANTAR domain-containing protein [Mycolicibacillus parakoreensis]|uniref:GAF and ANTAR domain-containing protein n=1 Tax=Mycolicibacillus parakoreensis TaxID=1069221 RepID=A0ABY3TXH8_9MYCO|nr:GAF and ANTAR domain-containing protein [Mycolicibacillus parakoreensis]ULN52424.1 GAF and ANTAR domain-containing protein [Mycolicibacillus parakoreensis]HLR99236.1 GAF and ANTAR domain-containing protein [Mycolicibacillus parakoreensis]